MGKILVNFWEILWLILPGMVESPHLQSQDALASLNEINMRKDRPRLQSHTLTSKIKTFIELLISTSLLIAK